MFTLVLSLFLSPHNAQEMMQKRSIIFIVSRGSVDGTTDFMLSQKRNKKGVSGAVYLGAFASYATETIMFCN